MLAALTAIVFRGESYFSRASLDGWEMGIGAWDGSGANDGMTGSYGRVLVERREKDVRWSAAFGRFSACLHFLSTSCAW